MKRVACIGTLSAMSGAENTSARLIDLYNSARVYNREHDVTGVFLVIENVFLQILEGDSSTINKLLYRMGQDCRISDVSEISDNEIDHPVFKGWTIRFLGDNTHRHQTFLEKLYPLLKNRCELKGQRDRERLQLFFKHWAGVDEIGSKASAKAVLPTATARCQYSRQVVSLSRWPRPSQLRLSHELISLCSSLVGKPVLFERLCARQRFGSRNGLIENLCALESIGILRRHAIPVLSERVAASENATTAAVQSSVRL